MVDNFLLNLDDKLRDLGNWEESNAHYRYNTAEKISIVGSQIIPPKTASSGAIILHR
jgi:hypothetical protein